MEKIVARFCSMGTAGAAVDAGGAAVDAGGAANDAGRAVIDAGGAAVDAGGAVVDAGWAADEYAAETAAEKEVSSTLVIDGISKLDARGLRLVGNVWFVTPGGLRPAATVAVFLNPLYLVIEARDPMLISGSMGGGESTRYRDETVYAGKGGTGKSRVFETADEILSPDLGRGLGLRFL